MLRIDARIPLRFGDLASRTADDAVLRDADIASDAPGPRSADRSHPTACPCCLPRSRAAEALAQLFRGRATGQGRWFTAVLAVLGPAAQAEVRAAVANDPLVSARFRLVGDGVPA